MQREFQIADDDYAITEEVAAIEEEIPAIKSGLLKHFIIYPVEVWLAPVRREPLRAILDGVWLTPQDAIAQLTRTSAL